MCISSNRFFIGGDNLRGFKYRRHRPARQGDRRRAGRQSLLCRARPSCASRWACPRSCAIFGRTFVDAGTLSDIDVSGPTLDESNGLRVAGRRRPVLAVAARARCRSTSPQPIKKETRTRPSSSCLSSAPGSDDGPEPPFGGSTGGAPGAGDPAVPRSAAWPPGPASAQDKLPPAVAAVIDYQRILRDAKAAQGDPRPGRGPPQALSGRDRQGGAAAARGRQGAGTAAQRAVRRKRSPTSAGAFESEVAGVQRMAQERRRQLDQAARRGAQRGPQGDDRGRGRARRTSAGSTSCCRARPCCCSRPRST